MFTAIVSYRHAFSSLGIYAKNSALNNSDQRYHDTTGVTTYGSPNAILTPVFQNGDIAKSTNVVMFNQHSEINRGSAIDNVISCVKTHKFPSQCASLTDFVQLLQFNYPNPAAILFYPIFPTKVASKRIVGVTSVVFVWKVGK
jgi:hypothetical protein